MMDERVSNPRSSGLIDSFASVQAARRAASRGQDRAEKPTEATPPGGEPPPEPGAGETRPAARFTRTALPEKFEVVCYECGYTFPMTGRIKNTLCPRCRVNLEKRDYRLESDVPPLIKTIGAVSVLSGARLSQTSITAHDVAIAGDATQATIICQLLRLQTDGSLDLTKTTLRDVIVEAEHTVSLPQPLSCRNLEILGELDARVAISGCIHVRPGGHLKGFVQTAHLVVEEGGGLSATLDVGPHISLAPPREPRRIPSTSKLSSAPAVPAPEARGAEPARTPAAKAPARRKARTPKTAASRK